MILTYSNAIQQTLSMKKTVFTRRDRDEAAAAMLAALPRYSNLRERMRKCGRWDVWANNTFYCRTAACPQCRSIYIKRQQRQMRERFANARREDMSMVTICFGAASHVEEIGEGWTKSRKALNYVVSRLRRTQRRWLPFDIVGWLEADPFTPDDAALLGDQQQALLASMNCPWPRDGGGACWMFHLHGIAHHPNLAWQDVRITLEDRWSKPRQIKVENLYDWRPKNDSIDAITAYSLKYEPFKAVGNGIAYWPAAWMADYYEWMFGFSRSYQSIKFSIGARPVPLSPLASIGGPRG